MDIEKCGQLLDKMGYRATATPTKDGCVVTLPLKLFGEEVPFRERQYSIDFKRKVVTVKDGDELGDEYVMDCPPYAARLAIWCDIIVNCQLSGYNPKLVKLIDINNSTELLPPIKNKQQEHLEENLTALWVKAKQNDFDPQFEKLAEEEGVIEGYKLLLGIYGYA